MPHAKIVMPNILDNLNCLQQQDEYVFKMGVLRQQGAL
jgi:hypothetical protein